MDLYSPKRAPFTEWIVESGTLDAPFVVVDVGCQGGIHERWRFLGDHLALFAFDALDEAIDAVRAMRPSTPHRHLFATALGSSDGTRTIGLRDNRFETSFYGIDPAAMATRNVPVARLDTLFESGAVPPIDVIKLDCEGDEAEVLKGAQGLLARSELLGVEVETNFNNSPLHPLSHFHSVYDQLARHKMLLVDLAHDRVPAPAFVRHLPDLPPSAAMGNTFGRISTCNALLARNARIEAHNPESFGPTVRPIGRLPAAAAIKLAILYELYGLPDMALDTLGVNVDVLAARLDLEKSAELLTQSARSIATQSANLVQPLEHMARALGVSGGPSLLSREIALRLSHLDEEAMKIFEEMLGGNFRV